MATPEQSPEPSNNDHNIRKLILPSGRTIEVVYYSNADEQPNQIKEKTIPKTLNNVLNALFKKRVKVEKKPRTDEDLHICPDKDCASELVYPTEWEEHDKTKWEVALHCPECDLVFSGIYEQTVVDKFDENLDKATVSIIRDLKRLTKANMTEEVEYLHDAFNYGDGDLLTADDFNTKH
jgi:hypothetical protein